MFSKIKSYLHRKFLAVVNHFEARAVNRAWEDARKTAYGQFTEAQLKYVKALIDNEITYLKVYDQSNGIGRTHLSQSLLTFRLAVATIQKLQVLTNIVGVQPMQGPVSLAFHMKYKLADVPGSELALDAAPAQTLRLEIVSAAVQAETRKLQVQWTTELYTPDRVESRDSFEGELIDLVSAQLADDIIVCVLKDLKELATQRQELDLDVISTPARNLSLKASAMCNEIARLTRRGAGNFVVASPMQITLMQAGASTSFVHATPAEIKNCNLTSLRLVGKMLGTIKVYSSLFMGDDVLIGYKGNNGETDTGYMYCPYIPVMTLGMERDPKTFNVSERLVTRYGKSTFTATKESPVSTGDYYGVITAKLFVADPVDQHTALFEDQTTASPSEAQ